MRPVSGVWASFDLSYLESDDGILLRLLSQFLSDLFNITYYKVSVFIIFILKSYFSFFFVFKSPDLPFLLSLCVMSTVVRVAGPARFAASSPRHHCGGSLAGRSQRVARQPSSRRAQCPQ